MGSLSKLGSLFTIAKKLNNPGVIARNMSDHRTFPLGPSRWQWNRFKDLFNYYAFIGIIPVTGVILYANLFIGPATLTELPADYVPKHWEYYRSPITRFIARYILNSPQQEYEKFLHYIFEEDEKRRIREVEVQIKAKMAERMDYQAYYYRPVLAKYHRVSQEAAEYVVSLRGD